MKKGEKATMAPGELLAVYQALDRVQAIIEFDLDGTVVKANENFLRLFGYAADEVIGKHHRMFCDPSYAESDDYAELWRKLGRGEYHAAEFRRLGKAGQAIWLRASYNPIFDAAGRPLKVVKFATDVTEAKLQTAEFEGRVRAIDRAQATIELDGALPPGAYVLEARGEGKRARDLVLVSDASLVLKADESADFGDVMTAIDVARSAGGSRLVLPARLKDLAGELSADE